MSTELVAVYEEGKLVLPCSLPLPEKTRVRVIIQTSAEEIDDTREAWLKESERALMKTWDNPEDDVFNELLKE